METSNLMGTNILKKLNKVQVELKAPKSQFNDFAKFKYRSVEDITESIKPLLHKHKVVLHITDETFNLGSRYYIKATATIYDVDSGEGLSTTGYARESENKSGMDVAQVTGSASSYARKYALNGLLAIDDNKDNDFLAGKTEDTEDPDKEIIKNRIEEGKDLAKEFVTALGQADDKNKAEVVEFMQKKKIAFDDISGGKIEKALLLEILGMLDVKEG